MRWQPRGIWTRLTDRDDPAVPPVRLGSSPSVIHAQLLATLLTNFRFTTLDLEDVFFLVLEQLVELANPGVGHLLELHLGSVLVVRAGVAGLLELAQVVHDVAPDVADRH